MPLNMFYVKEVIFVKQRVFLNIYAHLYLLPKDPTENMHKGFCISINEFLIPHNNRVRYY